MKRAFLLVLVGAALGAGGVSFAWFHEEGPTVRVISSQDIREKLDGKDSKVTFVEVTLEGGQVEMSHRHPGPGFVYVLEGQYELGVDDRPTKVYKAGETFYEATGALHRVGKNPDPKKRARLMAVVVHPRGEGDRDSRRLEKEALTATAARPNQPPFPSGPRKDQP